jgi:hypothetical protein
MREMLDDGEGFILVGFVKRPGGIQPVSFTRGCSDEVAEVVDDLTSVIAVQIMAQVTNNRDCKYAKGN